MELHSVPYMGSKFYHAARRIVKARRRSPRNPHNSLKTSPPSPESEFVKRNFRKRTGNAQVF